MSDEDINEVSEQLADPMLIRGTEWGKFLAERIQRADKAVASIIT